MGSFSKALAGLKRMDILSKETKLNIQGSTTVNTYVGAFFTCFYILVILAAAVYILEKYFNTEIPTVSSESYDQVRAPEINLAQQNILPFMIAYNGNSLITSGDVEKFVHIEVAQETWITTIDPDSGLPSLSLQENYFPVVACSDLTDEERAYYSYVPSNTTLRNQFNKNGICVRANSSYIIKGMTIEEVNVDVNYRVKPCILGNECYNQSTLEKFNFYMLLPMTNLNLSNYKSPRIATAAMNVLFYVVPDVQQLSTLNIGASSIKDYQDGKFVLPDWSQRDFYYDIKSTTYTLGNRGNGITCDPSQVGPKGDSSCASYLEFMFQSSLQYNSIRRTYQTSLMTFSMIGGVHNAILLTCLLLYTWYNERVKREYLIDNVYPFLQKVNLDEPEPNTIQNNNSISQVTSPRPPSGLGQNNSNQKSSQRSWYLRCFSSIFGCFAGIFWCFFRRKLSTKQRLRQLALDNILANLDVINIIKELNNLKFLTAILLNAEQLELVPRLQFANSYMQHQDKLLSVAGLQNLGSVELDASLRSPYMQTEANQMDSLIQESVQSLLLKYSEKESRVRSMTRISGGSQKHHNSMIQGFSLKKLLAGTALRQLLLETPRGRRGILPSIQSPQLIEPNLDSQDIASEHNIKSNKEPSTQSLSSLPNSNHHPFHRTPPKLGHPHSKTLISPRLLANGHPQQSAASHHQKERAKSILEASHSNASLNSKMEFIEDELIHCSLKSPFPHDG